MDDIADFQLTDAAMTHMGLSDAEKLAIYTVIAGVLHLGNVSFEESHDDSTGLSDQVDYLLDIQVGFSGHFM